MSTVGQEAADCGWCKKSYLYITSHNPWNPHRGLLGYHFAVQSDPLALTSSSTTSKTVGSIRSGTTIESIKPRMIAFLHPISPRLIACIQFAFEIGFHVILIPTPFSNLPLTCMVCCPHHGVEIQPQAYIKSRKGKENITSMPPIE